MYVGDKNHFPNLYLAAYFENGTILMYRSLSAVYIIIRNPFKKRRLSTDFLFTAGEIYVL